jgi:ATPase family associated with various cellular activities (AAA)
MSPEHPAQTWQRNNETHLSSALEWLRLKLERMIPAVPNAEPATPELEPAPTARVPSGLARIFGATPAPVPTPPMSIRALPAPSRNNDEEINRAHARMLETENVQPPPMLTVIGTRLGLSRFEQNVLLLCSAMELDTRTAGLCARAQDNLARPYPTFALALALFEEPTWDALSPERPLRYWRLLEINQPGAQALTTSALRTDERIVNALKGLDYLDDRLGSLFNPLEAAPQLQDTLPTSQQHALEAALEHLRRAAPNRPLPVIELVGPDVASQRLIAQHAVHALNVALYRLPLEYLPNASHELETLSRLWQRESLLTPIALFVDASESNDREASEVSLRRFLERGDGIVFVGTRDVRPNLGRETRTVDINKPTSSEQCAAWANALGPDHLNVAQELAGQFNLGLHDLQRIAKSALEQAALEHPALEHPDPQANALNAGPLRPAWDACRASTRPRLDALATRLETKATWNNLVLPEHDLRQLQQIANQVRTRNTVYEQWGFAATMNRGLGINALFAGESGTGKTMAAEVIANELRLDLYRIDLSSVVSKYIGETEKNLRKIFDAAEDGGAILFFDEADALFGKRSEVKDSHDRYANIEINYLLQRIEAYRGLALLATNLKTSLDTAFTRRLRFIINFPFPGQNERKRLWQNVFPPDVPLHLESHDLERLIRFDLTGAGIHNAALNAAFLAAQAGTSVTMTHLLEAIRNEYRKLERPINSMDFQNEPGKTIPEGAIA